MKNIVLFSHQNKKKVLTQVTYISYNHIYIYIIHNDIKDTKEVMDHLDYSSNPNPTYNMPTFFLQGHIFLSHLTL